MCNLAIGEGRRCAFGRERVMIANIDELHR